MSKEEGRMEIERLGIEESAGYKNLIAIRDYSKKTRDLTKDAEARIDELKALVVNQKAEIDNLRMQVQQLQIRLFSGGATT